MAEPRRRRYSGLGSLTFMRVAFVVDRFPVLSELFIVSGNLLGFRVLNYRARRSDDLPNRPRRRTRRAGALRPRLLHHDDAAERNHRRPGAIDVPGSLRGRACGVMGRNAKSRYVQATRSVGGARGSLAFVVSPGRRILAEGSVAFESVWGIQSLGAKVESCVSFRVRPVVLAVSRG